jgi:hypothetical protein
LSDKSPKSNSRISTLIVVGMVLVLLFTLMSFAFLQGSELLDYDDLSATEGGPTTWPMGYLFPASLVIGPGLGIYAAVMCLELLKSHIGEKSAADPIVSGNHSSLFARFSVTVLSYGTVFSFFRLHLWMI